MEVSRRKYVNELSGKGVGAGMASRTTQEEIWNNTATTVAGFLANAGIVLPR